MKQEDLYAKERASRENSILRELGNWGGQSSCVPFNYDMRRAAEMFFPVWELDKSFFLLEKCCVWCGCNEEQERIIQECMERHGMIEKVPAVPYDEDDIVSIVKKAMKGEVVKAFDDTLTPEERDMPTFLEWSDETLARAVREMAVRLGDDVGGRGIVGFAAVIALEKTLLDSNIAKLDVECGEVKVSVRIGKKR